MNEPVNKTMSDPGILSHVQASLDDALALEATDRALASLDRVRENVEKVVFGQRHVVEETLCALLAGGHALLIGAPGLAKTRLVETLGIVLGLRTQRVQFTPDLMPSDILGSEILDEGADGQRSFRFLQGPVFCELLMADEINRASPRTQSALLQAMQEHHVTIAGKRYDLPKPFHVLATQNPLEQEGVYPLPEAQLDRFLLQVDVSYPERDAERRILLETTGAHDQTAEPVMTPQELQDIQRLVRLAPLGEQIVERILDFVRAARPGDGDKGVDKGADKGATELISWGPGPRAAQALSLAARARALMHGRLAPDRSDLRALAEPVLKHRMALTFAARADGHTVESVARKLADQYL